MQSLEHQALAFFRSKPADEGYIFSSVRRGECGCAATQFTHFLGLDQDLGKQTPWIELHRRHGSALASSPHTFGALADRLAKELAA